MLLIRRIMPSLKEVGVTGGAANVLWRPGTGAGNTAWVSDAILLRAHGHLEDVDPTVPEIVIVKDCKRTSMRDHEIGQMDIACLEDPLFAQAIFVEFWGAVDQTTDIELMKMTVCPTERCLKHFVQLSQVEVHRQLESSRNRRLDVLDVDVNPDDEGITCHHSGEDAARRW